MERRAPWFSRMIGVPLLAFGIVEGVGLLITPHVGTMPKGVLAMSILRASACVIGGAGILFSRRRTWPVALLATFLILATGVVSSLGTRVPSLDGSPDGFDTSAIAILVLPSICVLVGLLVPSTRRWAMPARHVRVEPAV